MLRLDQREFRRILLIKPSSLGDIIHALPVLHGLRIRYPSAHIAWLLAREFRPLIEGHPDLDQVIEFDRKLLGRAFRSPTAAWELVKFLGALRRERFDLVVDLQGLFRSGVFSRATGASTRLLAGRAREFASAFATHRADPPPDDMHAVDANWMIAKTLGFERAVKQFNLALTDAERSRATQRVAQVLPRPGDGFVAFLPGARWETKRWPPERFARVSDQLQAHGVQVVILGAPSETDICRRISALSTPACPNLAGQTTLRELVAILEQSRVVLCHDSAPMHIAAALNRPIVAIFGPTNPQRTGPYHPQAVILRKSLPCSPCYLRTIRECPHHHQCMADMSEEEVFRATLQAWETAPVSPSTGG